jgi:hypothetical protein
MTTIYRCKAYTCVHNEDGCILEEIVIDGGYCCQEYIPRTKEDE